MSSGRNFTISSLLDSNEDNNRRAAQGAGANQAGSGDATIVRSRSTSPDLRTQYQAILSSNSKPSQPKFQRPILVEDSQVDAGGEVIVVDDDKDDGPGLGPPKRRVIKKKTPPPSTPYHPTLKPSGSNLPLLVPKPTPSASPTPSLSFQAKATTPSGISDQIRSFQTSFKLHPTPTPQSKTSITSIINVDDGPDIGASSRAPTMEPSATPAAASSTATGTGTGAGTGAETGTGAPAPPKKKRAPRRKKDPDAPDSKRRKPAGSTSGTPVVSVEDTDKKEGTPAVGDKKCKKTATKTPEPSAEGGAAAGGAAGANGNEKNGGAPAAPISATITSERNPKVESGNIPPPSIVELPEEKEAEKKPEQPIIALNIPLLDPNDPKPGQSQVIINVLKLTEEKYGWAVMHPNAKSAIDLMDDMIDDEEDVADEDDDEAADKDNEETKEANANANANSNGSSNANAKKKKEEEVELTEEQLVRQHEVKMNRKVGKYDYEDPFIDDEELQWEEEITSTKEGFFVYWGPLVDDRSSTTKKVGSKSKK